MDLVSTWTDTDEDDGDTLHRRCMIVPGCCERSKLGSVRLWFSSLLAAGQDTGYGEHYRTGKPVWVLSFPTRLPPGCDRDQIHRQRALAHVLFCPHCGKPTPELELREPPVTPLYDTDRWGDYCCTCSERSDSCQCYPPVFRWEVV